MFYWESWKYSNIDLHVWIMTGSSGSSDRPSTSSRVGSYYQLPFSYFLVLTFYGATVLLQSDV